VAGVDSAEMAKQRWIGQRLGIALYEEYVYDKNGQLFNGTLMDHLLPTAMDVPGVETAHLVTPSPFTPFGTKGAGESSINGSTGKNDQHVIFKNSIEKEVGYGTD